MKIIKNISARAIAGLCMAPLALAGGITAQAASITFSTSWATKNFITDYTDVDNQTDTLNDSIKWTFPQFDAALGTLQSVDISLSGVQLTSSAYGIYNDDDWVYANVAGKQSLTGMSIGVRPLLGYLWNGVAFTATSRSKTCSATGGLYSGATCNTSLKSSSQVFTDYNSTVTSAVALHYYTGPGSVDFYINQSATLFTDETDGDNGYVTWRSANVSTSGDIFVTYNYSPVPVPAAVWLFGSGLLGLVGAARRKKAA